jgi:transcriptional regulator with XRE-family HTH domain
MDIEREVAKIRELQSTRLRRYREQAGLTQQQAADKLGVSKMAVSKWEAASDPGDRWPELARLYGITERYPSAPFNAGLRRAFFDGQRNPALQAMGAKDSPSRK